MLEFLTDWLQRLLRQPAKLMYIGGSDILPPPLAAQEEQTLLQQAAAGDEAARAGSSSAICGSWSISRAGSRTPA